jgi:hypothetical protein
LRDDFVHHLRFAKFIRPKSGGTRWESNKQDDIQFKGDGKVFVSSDGYEDWGKWADDGNKVIITYASVEIEAVRTGDKMEGTIWLMARNARGRGYSWSATRIRYSVLSTPPNVSFNASTNIRESKGFSAGFPILMILSRDLKRIALVRQSSHNS